MNVVHDCTRSDDRRNGMDAARSALRSGRLVVLPTDTVYGIAADAFDSAAVADLLRAKGRGRDMPVPVLVGSWRTIDGLTASVPPKARDLIRAFWPGAVSLVVHQAQSLAWDLGDARGTVMLRMPLHPVTLELLRDIGPLAVSSANVSGKPPATTVREAVDQLGSSVSVYLDGGPAEHAVASTVIDLTGERPRILREGAVSAEAIAAVVGGTAADLRDPNSASPTSQPPAAQRPVHRTEKPPAAADPIPGPGEDG